MDCMLVAQSFSWTSAESWWAMGQVCIGLGLVIFVHELGHFLVAKACGVKCEKFYVGFDAFDIRIGDLVLIPRALLKYQWGETEYGIGIVPLGGYVKMLGQDDNPGNMEKEIERSKAEDGKEESEALGILDREKLDPRSYLAKSVPQRMAIISAGVIFNLIFAIIFAAIAFKSGVQYNPPVIGHVTPGGPGWEANLYGSEVKQIGDSVVADYYPFLDLSQEVALSGEGQAIDVSIVRPGSEEDIQKVSVTPRRGLRADIDLALIGIGPANIPKVTAEDEMFVEGHSAASADPPFEKNDLIVEVDGQPVNNVFDLKKNLARNFDQRLAFVVERGEDRQRVSINVDANPMIGSGIVTEWGPIRSVQKISPASGIGLQPGDRILKIDDQDPGNLFTLEQRLTEMAREAPKAKTDSNGRQTESSGPRIKLTILRDEQEYDFYIKPRVPEYFASLANNQPVAINSLGVAIEPTLTVLQSKIEGIEPGYKITHFEFDISDEKDKKQFKKRATNHSIDLTDSKANWAGIESLVQTLPAGFKFKVKLVKNLKTEPEVEVAGVTRVLEGRYLQTRGVFLTMMQETYQSPNWQDAFKFGVKQTGKDASRVFKFLGKLVRGQISPKNLGGPGMIAAAATSEASRGTSRLLLFLVLLSANLAIVNFLPIPVLDGGHMVFLAYEGLFRQPPNEKVQIILTYAGLFMVLGLMLYVIFLDIQRFSGLF